MNLVTSYCHISGEQIEADGRVVYRPSGDDKPFLDQVYLAAQLEYPKYHKMDLLSKAGFIGSELLKAQHGGLSAYGDDEIGLIFANSESSCDTDGKFEASYLQTHAPSPSLFVYTLPNIVMGEIAIRNKWYGEGIFGIFNRPDTAYYSDSAMTMFAKGMKAVLGGWLDVHNGLDVLLFLMERDRRRAADSTGYPDLEQLFENKFNHI